MRCPQCGADNTDGARFCGGCGIPFPAVCRRCAAENPPDNRFCGRCGAALDAPLGELRQVTLLFCDLVNSTGLAERLGPEAMHELLRSFLDTALAQVQRFEGTAPQFLGDGFMALFGAPVAHEDHVRRALLAALAIDEAVRALAARTGGEGSPALSVRIGIHTGLVVFGAVAANLRMDHTAIGDAANVAARLQQAADPGTIVISEETRRLAQGHVRVAAVGALRLKGKAAPVSAFRLLGYSHRRARRGRAAPSGPRDFVGRDREIATLGDLVRQVKAGRGRAVGLVGEPGIGKSRLLAEFRRRIRKERVAWIDGRCLSYGTAIPYLLVLDLLRSTCGMREDDSRDAIAEKLRLGLERAGMDAGASAPLLLRLFGIDDAAAASAPANPEALKTKTIELLCQLTLAGSRQRPLILALEDLQWIDKLSEEVLQSLGGRLAGAPILLVAAYRPEYRPPWLGEAYASEIALEPLNRDDSARLARSVLGVRPDAEPLTGAILANADGNPLFLEQLALQAMEGGHPRPPGAVPGTIRDVVTARIDRLPEETKRLLQTAAVIGREFSVRLLREVRPGSGPLEGHLDALARLEFIHERAGSDGAAFVFRHALTQETAYASLLARDRRGHHAAVGGALEKLFEGRSEEVGELLAFHFGRSDIADKAVDYAISAGEKVQRRWANTEALGYFEAALARLDAMPDAPVHRLRRVDAVLKQGEIRYALGEYAEHLRALDAIRALVEETGEPRRLATWHYWTGFLHSLTGGRPQTAIEHCRAAARIAGVAGLDDIEAVAAACLTQVYIVAGRLHEAVEAGQRALASFEARGDLWWASRTLWLLSIAANYLGEWETSLAHCRRALEFGIALGDLRVKAVSWARMGTAFIHRGDVARGMQCCEEALSLEPLARDAAWARAVRGYGQVKAGDLDAGIAGLNEALGWFAGSRMRYTYLVVAGWLAEGHLRRGNRAEARGLIEDVLETSRLMGYRHFEGRASELMAEYLRVEAPAAAADHADAALRIFEQVGASNDCANALLTRAALHREAGESSAARRLCDKAAAIFARLGTRDGTARTASALAGGWSATAAPLSGANDRSPDNQPNRNSV